MSNIAADPAPARTLGDATLLGVALVLVLMGLNLMRHPASVDGGGLTSVVACVAILLLYGVAAIWVRMRPAGPMRTALSGGAALGLALGIAQAAHIFMEHFADLRPPFDAIVGGGSMGLMILCFGAAGAVAFQRTGSLPLAVLAAIWCATLAMVIVCLSGFAIDLAFMSHLERNVSPAFARSGMADPRAFVVRNTVENASNHLLTAPPLAAVVGLLAGIATAGLRSARREVAIALAGLVIVQMALSVAVIRHGLSLERPRRPPFIMTGMLLGGLALAGAYPVLAAACSPSSRWGQLGPPGRSRGPEHQDRDSP
jgi:hypothetical protein